MQTLEQQYKEFEKTQDAIDKGIPARDIPRYLQLTQEEKEDYIKYLQETGKDRL
jgi:heat shock protein HspQ